MVDALEVVGWPIIIIFSAAWIGFVFFLAKLPRTIKSKSWPIVEGRVIRSVLKKRESRGGSGNVGVVKVFDIDLLYEYSVNGVLYRSKRDSFFHLKGNSEKFFRNLAKRYHVDKIVNVYYNPRQPKISVLEPGISSGVVFLFVFFIIVIVSIGSVILVKMGY